MHSASIEAIEEVGCVSGGDAVDIRRDYLGGCDVLCWEHDVDIFLKGDDGQNIRRAKLRDDVFTRIPDGGERLTIHRATSVDDQTQV